MTRARMRRRGHAASSTKGVKNTSHDQSATAAQLQECLPESSFITPLLGTEQPTAEQLRPFFRVLSTETDPKLHLCLANFLHALLPCFETLPLLCTLAEKTSLSPQAQDTAALSVCIRAVLFLGQSKPHDEVARDEFARALPTLITVLRTAIFKARHSMLSLSSPTDGGLNISSSLPTSMYLVRPHALRLLNLLAELVSRPLTKYWIQLLPSRPMAPSATGSGSDNLATLILHDSQTEVRSLAVTAITTLISGSTTFIRNSRSVSPAHKHAFTTTSDQVRNCCRNLIPILSVCLQKETDGVIVAKLARLTAQLFYAMSAEGLSGLPIQTILEALLHRALDQSRTDLTARIACASALGNALSTSAVLLEPCFVNTTVSRITTSLDSSQPVAELLASLRAIVDARADLFSNSWFMIRNQLRDLCSNQDIALHAVRVFDTFLTATLRRPKVLDLEDSVLLERIPVVLDVYHFLIESCLETDNRILCTSAVTAVRLLLQFHSAIAEGASALAAPRYSCKHELEAVVENAVHRMKHLASTASDSVRAAAIRALVFAHPEVQQDFPLTTFKFLFNTMRSSGKDGSLIARFCMSSMTILVDILLPNRDRWRNGELLTVLEDATLFAVETLQCLRLTNTSTESKSASDRANTESNKTAAIGLIVCLFRTLVMLGESEARMESFGKEEMNLFRLLCELVQNDSETVNLRCCCCKALGSIISVDEGGPRKTPLKWFDCILDVIIDAVSPKNNLRIQICAATSLLSVMAQSSADHARIRVIRNCIKCHLAVVSDVQKGATAKNTKTQQRILQNTLGELVFETFLRTPNDSLATLASNWEKEWDSKVLISCVSTYLSIPSYAMGASSESEFLFMETSPDAMRVVMEKIFRLRGVVNQARAVSEEQDVQVSKAGSVRLVGPPKVSLQQCDEFR
ncbi:hypothetical protein BWQ96_00729 [Gracilariopsis chorda]|uniref:DUF4042 domain-containing protein n=1 Tax=Gracilariopsis chorda TaxID=448386 RepID=A0A2V3J520_9FLOR|nr:hypothetical protein BWQ96_00729 [Gracilariopsis chorda]|eukprot:PXF49413.1 hypothetical protein BWQ96_00729 [Gracilariopsis chorda]